MGRNAGSQIHWSAEEISGPKYTWYCQQHAKYDQASGAVTLLEHLEQEHGCVRQ